MDIFWALRGFFRAHWRSYCIAALLLVGVALLGLLPPAIVGRVVDGFAAAQGGVFSVDGRMVDAPVVALAQQVLARAARIGVPQGASGHG